MRPYLEWLARLPGWTFFEILDGLLITAVPATVVVVVIPFAAPSWVSPIENAPNYMPLDVPERTNRATSHIPGRRKSTHNEHGTINQRGQDGRIGHRCYGRTVDNDPIVSLAEFF